MSSDSPAVSIGVDFGTSNTVVALATGDGRVETVRFAHGEATQSVYASALCFWQEPSRRGLPPSVEGGPWAIERLIEHNLEVVKTADWIIDMGPEGGDGGGQVVAMGTPEEIARHAKSYTGAYLKEAMARRPSKRKAAAE